MFYVITRSAIVFQTILVSNTFSVFDVPFFFISYDGKLKGKFELPGKLMPNNDTVERGLKIRNDEEADRCRVITRVEKV